MVVTHDINLYTMPRRCCLTRASNAILTLIPWPPSPDDHMDLARRI